MYNDALEDALERYWHDIASYNTLYNKYYKYVSDSFLRSISIVATD